MHFDFFYSLIEQNRRFIVDQLERLAGAIVEISMVFVRYSADR